MPDYKLVDVEGLKDEISELFDAVGCGDEVAWSEVMAAIDAHTIKGDYVASSIRGLQNSWLLPDSPEPEDS